MRLRLEINYDTFLITQPLSPQDVAGLLSAFDGSTVCKRDGYGSNAKYVQKEEDGQPVRLELVFIDDFDHRVPPITLKQRAEQAVKAKVKAQKAKAHKVVREVLEEVEHE